jgi:hypothetical protein
MFCLMDVSGSMDEARKDLAKRFFILLYLFLTRHYEKIDIVFIRHHTQAQEVDEQNFFHSTETGGTVVSSALVLMEEIAKARYPTSEWNIYGAQASDGDNWHHDSGRCRELLANNILPLCRYFAYVQVAEEEQNLWDEYSMLAGEVKAFAIRKVTEASQIYPVFRSCSRRKERRHDSQICGGAARPDTRPVHGQRVQRAQDSRETRGRRHHPAKGRQAPARANDWTFDLIEEYHAVIRQTAQRFGLDTYPNQLEIITAEQMMDAYASVGMPVNYRHWSYGKEFIATERTIGAATWAWPTKSSSTPTPASAT